jgi:hypothetical protein
VDADHERRGRGEPFSQARRKLFDQVHAMITSLRDLTLRHSGPRRHQADGREAGPPDGRVTATNNP